MTPLGNKPFENTMGKGEIARYEQFLLFPQCFLPVWITFCHFRQISNRRLQTLSIRKSKKSVVWERVKDSTQLHMASLNSLVLFQILCQLIGSH